MRLFIALNFPVSLRQDIQEATAELRAADYPVRWVSVDSLHLTLKFLGEVEAERVAGLRDVVELLATRTRPFSMEIDGLGAFPNPRNPRTIWAGCEHVPQLELLQHGIETECMKLGFPTAGNPFRPHITIGRVRKRAGRRQLTGIDRDMERVSLSTAADFGSIELMQSTIDASGPTYTVLHSGKFAQ